MNETYTKMINGPFCTYLQIDLYFVSGNASLFGIICNQ